MKFKCIRNMFMTFRSLSNSTKTKIGTYLYELSFDTHIAQKELIKLILFILVGFCMLQWIYVNAGYEALSYAVVSPLEKIVKFSFFLFLLIAIKSLQFFKKCSSITGTIYYESLLEALTSVVVGAARIGAVVFIFVFTSSIIALFRVSYMKITTENIPKYIFVFSIGFIIMFLYILVLSAVKAQKELVNIKT